LTMSDDQFKALCNTYGFAPSRALREMLDKVEEMEREACAKVCERDELLHYDPVVTADKCAAAIRARGQQ